MATERKSAPFAIHPGEHLKEFIEEYGITQYRLAKDIGVPQDRVSKIIRGQRGITAETALRLGRYFDMSPEFWIGLNEQYELECAKRDLGPSIAKQVKPIESAVG